MLLTPLTRTTLRRSANFSQERPTQKTKTRSNCSKKSNPPRQRAPSAVPSPVLKSASDAEQSNAERLNRQLKQLQKKIRRSIASQTCSRSWTYQKSWVQVATSITTPTSRKTMQRRKDSRGRCLTTTKSKASTLPTKTAICSRWK